jgi:phosphate transport system substrate-binding protein
MMTKFTVKRAGLVSAALAGVLFLAACSSEATPDSTESGAAPEAGLSGSVAIDGSSTVAPLSEAAATQFRDIEPDVSVTVATSGTGGGFQKFCAGETDISDASRPVKDEEAEACAAAGIEFTEIVVANDGLSVVVNLDNDWAQCLTVEQLNKIWGPESEGEITNWNQIDPSFPDEELVLFGAGTDSGTFDYFTDAINDEEGAIRTDYSPSEDDNITVQGVSGATGGMGFFGLSYVEENSDLIKAIEVDGGDGCVYPTNETVQSGEYQPLGRQLYIYVNNASYTDKPQVKSFVDFFVSNSSDIAVEALFVPLTDEQITTAQEELASLS